MHSIERLTHVNSIAVRFWIQLDIGIVESRLLKEPLFDVDVRNLLNDRGLWVDELVAERDGLGGR